MLFETNTEAKSGREAAGQLSIFCSFAYFPFRNENTYTHACTRRNYSRVMTKTRGTKLNF